MIPTLYLPVSLVLGLLIFSLIAKWYIGPLLAPLPRRDALTPLLLLHASRYVGLTFLIPGVTATVLDPRFAEPAAYGDLLAAVLALIALLALRLRWAVAIPLVWIFNIEGTLDLLNAVARGLLYTDDGQLGATYFIPAIVVPALLVSHGLVFWLLVRPKASVEGST